MRVFLTGSSGKIGSVVDRIFTAAGHEIVGFDKAKGDDIMDAAAVHKAMEGCDWVAHLAMAMGKQYAAEETFASGTVGTFNVLQAAEAHGVKRIASYSSVNAMGLFMGEDTPDFLPLDESHTCRPGRPYGTSKYLGEEICRLFTQRTGVPTVCIRPPAVWTDEYVVWIREARAENAEFEWTPYWEYGCYIHVEDLAQATLCALTPATCRSSSSPVTFLRRISRAANSCRSCCLISTGAVVPSTKPTLTKRWSTMAVPDRSWAGSLSSAGGPSRSLQVRSLHIHAIRIQRRLACRVEGRQINVLRCALQ